VSYGPDPFQETIRYFDAPTAYWAGLFDGEGSVGINRKAIRGKQKRFSYQCEAKLTMCDEDIVYAFSAAFDGTFGVRYPKKANVSVAYTSGLGGRKCLAFLTKILPHARVKKKEIEVAIEYLHWQKALTGFDQKTTYRYTEEDKRYQALMRRLLHDLKPGFSATKVPFKD
jgi:hypothetical protein